MAAFKVGDRVRITSPVPTTGTVVAMRNPASYVDVRRDDGRRGSSSVTPGAATYHVDNLEPANYEPEKGDRVRVTLEGEVTDTGTHDGHHFDIEGGLVFTHREGVTVELVEKAKPPVVTFEPGDFVREKGLRDALFLIGPEGGWTDVRTGRSFDYSSGDTPWTSEHFEKVELHEAPL